MDPSVHYTTQSSSYDRLTLATYAKPEPKRPKPNVPTQLNRSARREGKRIAYSLLVYLSQPGDSSSEHSPGNCDQVTDTKVPPGDGK